MDVLNPAQALILVWMHALLIIGLRFEGFALCSSATNLLLIDCCTSYFIDITLLSVYAYVSND